MALGGSGVQNPPKPGCLQNPSVESLFAPPGAAGMFLGPLAGDVDAMLLMDLQRNGNPIPSGTQNLNQDVINSALWKLEARRSLDAMTVVEVGLVNL